MKMTHENCQVCGVELETPFEKQRGVCEKHAEKGLGSEIQK